MIPYLEHLGPHFTKFFIEPNVAIHHFTAPDLGDFHDHPFDIEVQILRGCYMEEVVAPTLDHVSFNWWSAGDRFIILADHIHRIAELTRGPVTTLATYGPWQRKSRFWRFGDKIEVRDYDGDWAPYSP